MFSARQMGFGMIWLKRKGKLNKMNIRIADKTEFYAVRAFYHKVIDLMQDAQYKPAWEKGVYPSDAYLRESLENGELWVCEYDGGYAAAMVVNHKCNAEYKSVRWSVDAKEDEVMIVHALCVLPTLQGNGFAGALVRKAQEIAVNTYQKTVRLDVLEGNLPAERLYLKHGFRYVDTIQLFYEDTGWTDFRMFEYLIAAVDPSKS